MNGAYVTGDLGTDLAVAAIGGDQAHEMIYGDMDVVNHTSNDHLPLVLSPTTDEVVTTVNMEARTIDESSRCIVQFYVDITIWCSRHRSVFTPGHLVAFFAGRFGRCDLITFSNRFLSAKTRVPLR